MYITEVFELFLFVFSFLPLSPCIFQIEYVVNGSVPSDLSEALVLDKSELDRLKGRIQQLQGEKLHQKDLHRQARQQHTKLIHDRRNMAATIQSKSL